MIFFSADLHLGSSNIIEYCKRPFKSREHMIKRLINEINQKCGKPGDVLYHDGDFVLYGKERGIESTRVKPQVYEDMIKPQLVHILGNHDLNNGVKGALLGAYIKIGKRVAWIQHVPPWYEGYIAPKDCDVYLCGHVHDKWKFRTYNDKLCINVGVDVNNYRPVSIQQIVRWLDEFNKGELKF